MDTTAPAEPPRARQGLRLGGADSPALLAALGAGSVLRPRVASVVLTAACTFLAACGVGYWIGTQRVDAQPTSAARATIADSTASAGARRAALVRLEADASATLRVLRGLADAPSDPFHSEAAEAIARLEQRR